MDVIAAMQKLGVQSTFSSRTRAEDEDKEGFSIPNYHKRQLKKKLTHLLTTSTPMTEEEAMRIVDLWSPDLSVGNRMSLYKFWLHRYHVSFHNVLLSVSPGTILTEVMSHSSGRG